MSFFPEPGLFKTYFEMGGFVMYPLALIAVLLWYALVYRAFTVAKSKYAPRDLIRKAKNGSLNATKAAETSAVYAVGLADQLKSRSALKSQLEEHLLAVRSSLARHKVLVHSLVAVAPLLGLLGTVDGMIETFDSLGDMVLFSQSGGIAGGISKALFTTQIGLMISIPGLLIGRILDKRETDVLRDIHQIRDLVCARPATH